MRRGGWPGPALAPQRMQLLPCVLGKRHPLYLPPTASLGRFSFVSPSLGKRGDSSGAIASARAGRLRGPEEGAPGAWPQAQMPGAVLGAWPLRLSGHQWAGMFPWQVYFVLGMGEGEVGAGFQGCWVLEGSQLSVPRELEGG